MKAVVALSLIVVVAFAMDLGTTYAVLATQTGVEANLSYDALGSAMWLINAIFALSLILGIVYARPRGDRDAALVGLSLRDVLSLSVGIGKSPDPSAKKAAEKAVLIFIIFLVVGNRILVALNNIAVLTIGKGLIDIMPASLGPNLAFIAGYALLASVSVIPAALVTRRLFSLGQNGGNARAGYP